MAPAVPDCSPQAVSYSKPSPSPAPLPRHFVSYDQIHNIIQNSVPSLLSSAFSGLPDHIVAISGGGLIPARILRTMVKQATGKTIPIHCIGLELYNDDLEIENPEGVKRLQWLHDGDGKLLALVGKRLLIVDEVDDTRQTLAYTVREIKEDVQKQGGANADAEIGVFVVHNKNKPKKASLPAEVMSRYVAGESVEGDRWVNYPWNAVTIEEHTSKAEALAKNGP